MQARPWSRRNFLATGVGVTAGTALVGNWTAASAAELSPGMSSPRLANPFPLSSIRLLDSPFRANQERNSAYLHFVDLDRLLHTFRLNVGLPSTAQPCGGWEDPAEELRGHSTGHLMSGLAITYANTGDTTLREKGIRLVSGLAECQRRSPQAGYSPGYLSAFPEDFFDRLETTGEVWAPYYTLHKILAGLLDQYQLANNEQALQVLTALADWVDRRTAGLSYEHMQRVLDVEFGGMNEVLANLAVVTGEKRYVAVAERFSHARIEDPLSRNEDLLAGEHANTQLAKVVGAMRLWEETGKRRYYDVGNNFWNIVVSDHTYVIGGNSNGEVFHEPGAIASQLSESTCENCNSYNMLKLTRLLHFHHPNRMALLDYYERTLFNQMLGEQDPDSAHGFNIYYTGLAPGAFKRQPDFMGTDPNAYSTDYDNFSCDHGTGMETQARFAEAIYSHGDGGLYVNLFIPSEVSMDGIRLRQRTEFPDEAATHLEVVEGSARMALRIRVPAWVAGNPLVKLNGKPLDVAVSPGEWLLLEREWSAGETVDLTLPMALAIESAPDDPGVGAVVYGPIVFSGEYGDDAINDMPVLDTATIKRKPGSRLAFSAVANGSEVSLSPIARVHHQHHNVYWRTSQ